MSSEGLREWMDQATHPRLGHGDSAWCPVRVGGSHRCSLAGLLTGGLTSASRDRGALCGGGVGMVSR